MISDQTKFEDLKDIVCGNKLGAGIHREVYELRILRDLKENFVIKYAPEDPTANILEWEIWDMVQRTNIAKWFAPCKRLSANGLYLVQQRVEFRPHREYPVMVPNFFSDLKYSNYGWIGDQLVACDYAGFLSCSMTHKWSGRMKKADWWE